MEPEPPRNPMPALPWQLGMALAWAAPRCGAKTRAHTPCQAAAMPNGRCRLHGGRSTGPRTVEGLERMRAARTKHGLRSAEAVGQRALVRTLLARAEQLVEMV